MPSVGVMTTQFVSAAELMARVLGADGYAFATIDHPISSASDAALVEQARLTALRSQELLLIPSAP